MKNHSLSIQFVQFEKPRTPHRLILCLPCADTNLFLLLCKMQLRAKLSSEYHLAENFHQV